MVAGRGGGWELQGSRQQMNITPHHNQTPAAFSKRPSNPSPPPPHACMRIEGRGGRRRGAQGFGGEAGQGRGGARRAVLQADREGQRVGHAAHRHPKHAGPRAVGDEVRCVCCDGGLRSSRGAIAPVLLIKTHARSDACFPGKHHQPAHASLITHASPQA